jgi:hypothetical protein
MSDILCSSSSVGGGGTGRGEDVVIGRSFGKYCGKPGRSYEE